MSRRLLPAFVLAAAGCTAWAASTGTAAAAPARSAHLVHAPGASTPAPERAQAFGNAGVLAYGDAPGLGGPTAGRALNAPVVGMAPSHGGKGYWLVAADGGVFAYGEAAFEGSVGNVNLYAPIVGVAATASGQGYWEVALDGGVFSFGDAPFYGSTGGIVLNQPVVGMAPTPDGRGYWLVAADGGIFTFGDAQFYGSTGSLVLNSPIVGMAATPDGLGYWLVAADGGIFTFGDAQFYGSTGNRDISASVSGMASTHDGSGYWLVGSDGTVYPFGDAVPYGQSAPPPHSPSSPIAAIVPTPTGGGYWLLEPDAFPTGFSHPGGGSGIVKAAASQVTGVAGGPFCNPYGPCEPWCALFATWAWQTGGGLPIPRYAFVGDVYTWAVKHTAVLPPYARPAPGDAVLYGTGPASVSTAVHMGIVAQVWPDGAIDTVEGDAGPGPAGHFSVVINGPYLPSQSANYNGVPIFAFAVP